jgi:hypothetical protein
MSTYDPADPGPNPARRQALTCLAAWSGAAVVWTVAGGVPRALRATSAGTPTAAAKNALTFVQISDTHIGFRKVANPDVVGSLRRAIADINALPQAPAFVVHTGDVSHLSKPEEFGKAREVLQEIRVDRVHTIPGEHDTIDDGVTGYLKFFDHDGNGKAWYSFDQGGVQITVAPGTKIIWTNRDETPHTVTSNDKSFASKGLDTDDKFEHTFGSEGDFSYICTVHPFMTGVVHVRKQ